MVADRHNNFIVGPRGPFQMDDFQLLTRSEHRDRTPRFTAVSLPAAYGGKPLTIDVTDYAEIRSPSKMAAETANFLRSAIGPLVVLAAAVAVAVTLLVLPAPDRPALVAGPLSGHSLLHFPR
jgi:hypothetical protein